MMHLLDELKKIKIASHTISLMDDDARNNVLISVANMLRSSTGMILEANAKDLKQMEPEHPMRDRLLLTESRLNDIASDIQRVINLPSLIGKLLEHRDRPNHLSIDKIAVPIGVVAIIYESRPNVTLDAFSLCFKTGNACILKGGKEAFYTNTALMHIIHRALAEHHVSTDVAFLFPPSREDTAVLLNATGLVDVCIPRGSQALIDFVRTHARIPVIETGAGIVHTYFDVDGDLAKGRAIILNAKTRRVSVCNALDCLVIHKDRLSDLPALIDPLTEHDVHLFADHEAYEALKTFYPSELLHHAKPAHYGQEFLSYKMAIKTVKDIDDAILHIMAHTSQHSEAIVTDNKETADYFIKRIDAAVVYVNASTAFTDGGEFGMGAEIGISTQKLHARGPMGLEALTTYQWVVRGAGQIR